LGVRNSIIQQYQPLKGRADQGALWENFLVAERMKYLHARLRFPKQYFWRTHDHQELDYVEEADGQLHGYEFKWNPKKAKAPVAFAKAYPKAEVQVLHRQNFEPFLLD
jgi:predicted AAA+ superfamily ATPase